MIKAQVAPGLRALGFKGSGRNYEFPSPYHWAVLGFQSSKWSDSDEVSFTVNLLVVSRDAWERERAQRPYLPATPNANMFPGEPVWWTRVGALMPGGEDTWWRVRARANTEAVAREVLRAIETYAVPAMRAQLAS